MTTDILTPRSRVFATTPLAWIVVNHFLSPDLLEEFSMMLVEVNGGDQVALGDLFDTQRSVAQPVLKSWLIQPKPVDGDIDRLLQEAVRVVVWQSDGSVYAAQPDASGPYADLRNSLAAAFDLASVDFGTVESWLERSSGAPEELLDIAKAIARTGDQAAAGAWPDLTGVSSGLRRKFAFPLSAILVKHLGDLAADADCPTLATALYLDAEAEVAASQDAAWSEFRANLLVVILQSRAAMLRLTDGPGAAAALLNTALDATPFETQPLLHVNATLDAMEATHLAGDNNSPKFKDVRPSMRSSPQVHLAWDFSSAFTHQAEKEFRSANRRYWAGIRRLVAGGSAHFTREAKAHYARSLLDELNEVSERHRRPDTFRLAMRLLIESGRQDLAKATSWPKPLLEAYLDADAITAAIAHMSKLEGARPERLGVLIAMVRNWLRDLPHEKDAEAESLMRFLAEVAMKEPWSQDSQLDFSRAAFQAIKATAEVRPEFRRAAADPIVEAIVKHLGENAFFAWIGAFEAGASLVEALPDAALRKLLGATLDRLEALDPKAASWPVVRPAMGILTEEASRQLWQVDSGLAHRCAITILRYGLEQETERTRLLSLLGTIGPYLSEESRRDPRVDAVVAEVRQQVHQINSTAVTSNICALLASPAVSGLAGIRDAIDAMREILEAATGPDESIATSYAYSPLMILTQTHIQMAKDLGPAGANLDELMRSLLHPLLAFWRTAAGKPALFAPLSFPEPSAPNSTLVHNWTFASIGFARMLEAEDALAAAMAEAANQPLLARGMATGRAARLTAGDPEVFRPEALAREPAVAFYAALGQRIVRLRNLDTDARVEMLEELVRQCFRHGPNGLDAVVFSLAQQGGASIEPDSLSYREYRVRLASNNDLRIGLTPILDDLANGRGYEALF